MDRRDFMLGAGAVSALATPLLAGLVGARAARAQTGAPAAGADDEAAAAYAELAALIGEIESDFIGAARGMNTPAERAAGRYLVANTLLHGFKFWFEADPRRPLFYRWTTPTEKLLGDNPDAVYYGCVVDPAHEYRIRGNVHGADYTSFTVERGTRGGGLSTGLVATLNDTEFDVAADGSYEIIASPRRQPRNWLRLEPDAGSITTRHYFEWERSAAADPTLNVPVWIEPLEDPGPAAPMDDAAVAEGIRRVVTFVRGVTVDFPNFPPDKQPAWVSREPNRFANPEGADDNVSIGYAAKDNVYRQARYEIAPDEALVIRGRFPRCRFANVMVWNHQMQTPPYVGRRVSLNRRQVAYEKDGSFRIVVAHRDPGTENWIDAAGATRGIVFWRFQLPEEPVPPLEAALVPLARAKEGA